MTTLALSPVSAAVYAALNVAALTALAPGGVGDDVPQGVTFPFVFYEVQENDLSGMGATANLPEIELRVHAYSTYAGFKEAQSIIDKVKELLRNQSITVTGFTQCGKVFYDRTVPLADQLINGVKCHELVAFFRVYVES